MSRTIRMRRPQQGMMLIEALIAILIFSIGVLGMIGMGSVAIASQSDAQYRTEAANYANEMASTIALAVARGTYNTATHSFTRDATLDTFSHQEVDGGYCSFAGAKSTNPLVTDWVSRISGGGGPALSLPGATDISQQIVVSTVPGGYNQVTISICWWPPSSKNSAIAQVQSRYTLVTYIN